VSLVCGYFAGMIFMKLFTKNVSYKINYEWKRIAIIAISSIIILIIGKYITKELDLELAFFIKFGLLILYLISLKVLRFFTPGELEYIKKIFKR
jgi:uncharacterized membrane protein YfcA